MPETLPDPASKWTPVPDWSKARLTRPGWRAASVGALFQAIVSGDVEAALAPRPSFVGLWEIARGPTAAIRIGRDRALLVSPTPIAISWGWQAGGWVVSDASDAYHVFDIAGPALRDVVAEATSADLEAGSPSAAIEFAGAPALLYRLGADQARLHVETALAAYVWRWLETR